MHDFRAIAQDYIAVWNATDADARRAGLETGWSPEARYVDPLVDATGHDQISTAMASAAESFPGFTFRLTGKVDGHHDQFRFEWEYGPDGVEAPVAGFDVVELDPDGRVRSVLGFLDRVPAPA